jgi:SnoaL-like domain/Domain of unknown function (DUF222)
VVGMDQDEGPGRDGAAGPGGQPAGAGGDVVAGALALIRTGISQLGGAALWARSDVQARDGVRETFAVMQSLHGAWLRQVGDLDSRPDPVPGAQAGVGAATFLKANVLRSPAQAAHDVRAAKALSLDADPGEGGLPAVGKALAQGKLSREHADVVLKLIRKLKKETLRELIPVPEDPFAPKQPRRSPQPEERPRNMKSTELTGVIAAHVAAVNVLDTDAIMDTFAPDAYVNDARREFVGADAVRRWVEREMVGDHVTIDVREVFDHHGDTIVRGIYDGTFDRTNLPDEIVLTNYFSVRDGKIVSLVVVFNQPAELS